MNKRKNMKLYKIELLKKGSLATFVFTPWQELKVPVLWKSWLSQVCDTVDRFWVFLWSQTSTDLIGFFTAGEVFGENTAERIKGSGLYCFVSGGCTLLCPIQGVHQGQHMVLLRLLWNEQEIGNMPFFANWVKATIWHKALHISFLSRLFSVISKHTWLSLSLTSETRIFSGEVWSLLSCRLSLVWPEELRTLLFWAAAAAAERFSVWWTWDSFPEDSFPLTAGFVFSFPGSCSLFEACLTSSFWFFSF